MQWPGSDALDPFRGAVITGFDFGFVKKKEGPTIVELTRRAKYLKETFHKGTFITYISYIHTFIHSFIHFCA